MPSEPPVPIPTVSLAEMAAKMGKTEDELRAWITDTPNRHRRLMERVTSLPQTQEVMRRQIEASRAGRKTDNG